MKNKLYALKPLAYLILLPMMGLIYNQLNHDNGRVYSLVTDLDTLIPFNKVFILPYMLWTPFVFVMLLYFFRKDRNLYLNTLITMVVGLGLNYLTFSVFQTTVPRPEVVGTDIFSQGVRWLYAHDQPYNCFPSGHVLTSYAIMYGCSRIKNINPVIKFLTKTTVVAIILSTQFLKQHTIMDAAAAVIIVSVVASCVEMVRQEGVLLWPERIFLLLTMRSR